jgi:hypothetical protein
MGIKYTMAEEFERQQRMRLMEAAARSRMVRQAEKESGRSWKAGLPTPSWKIEGFSLGHALSRRLHQFSMHIRHPAQP